MAWFSRFEPPEFMRRDSELARWIGLVWFGVGTVVGIGLLVLGSGLVALGAVLILNGFGAVAVDLPDELGTSLAAGLVVGVAGMLGLGLGVESQAGHGFVRRDSEAWEIAIAHVPGLPVFGWAVAMIMGGIERITLDVPEVIALLVRFVDAVGEAATWAGLVGVPVLWAIHQFVVPREPRLADFAPVAIFVAWVIQTTRLF